MDTPVDKGAGKDVTDRFNLILYIGSVTGLVEIFRNSLNSWAKCFHKRKLALAFSILGFITVFLFIFNFILMQLFRFTHAGKVCAGEFLADDMDLDDIPEPYMPAKGNFIFIMIMVIYGMVGLFLLSVFCLVLLSLSLKKNNRTSKTIQRIRTSLRVAPIDITDTFEEEEDEE